MTSLHLGVVDIPYSTSATSASSGGTAASHVSTGDVAEFIEARYGVMNKFMELHGQEVADAVAGAMQDKLETLLMGGPAPGASDVLLPEGSLDEAEQLFRKMLDKRELDGQVPGVPTAAAQAGVSHRLQHPYARRGPRPSFIDTGQFQSLMRAWVD